MHHDIRTMLNGTDQIGSTKGVIHYQRQTVLVGKLCQSVDIWNVAVGISEGFDVDGSGIVPNCRLHLREVVNVHKAGCNAEIGEGVSQQIIAATVDGLLCNDVTAVLTKGLQRVGDGGSTGCQSQSSDTLFQNILSRVGQSTVNVSSIREAKAGGCVFAVVEHVGGGSVDGNSTGLGSGIRRFLTNVKLKRFKFIVGHNFVSFRD